jgi:hypothetical protein
MLLMHSFPFLCKYMTTCDVTTCDVTTCDVLGWLCTLRGVAARIAFA